MSLVYFKVVTIGPFQTSFPLSSFAYIRDPHFPRPHFFNFVQNLKFPYIFGYFSLRKKTYFSGTLFETKK